MIDKKVVQQSVRAAHMRGIEDTRSHVDELEMAIDILNGKLGDKSRVVRLLERKALQCKNQLDHHESSLRNMDRDSND